MPPFARSGLTTRLLPSLLVLAIGCKDKAEDGGDAAQKQDSKADAADSAADDGKDSKPVPPVAPPPVNDGGTDDGAADGGGDATPTAELAPPAKLTADVATLVDALGDRALVTFVLRPSKWTQAQPGLDAVLSALPEPPLAKLGKAKSLVDFMMEAGNLAVRQDFTVLKGYDASKPIVGALFEPPPLQVAADPLNVVDLTKSRATRHVVLVPVTDGKAFVDSVQALFGADTQPNWIEGEGPAWTARVPNVGYLVVGIEGEYARLTILSEAEDVPADQAKALLRARVRPTVTAPKDSPAMQELVAGDGVLAVNVRPWRIAELAAFTGSHMMARALQHAPPDQKSAMLAAGLASVLSAELYVAGARPEFDDWTYALRGDGKHVTVTAVASLTPHGRTLWDAGKTTASALPVKAKSTFAEGYIRLDALKMLDAADPNTAFDPAKPDRAFDTFLECGMFCPLHAMHGAPVQLADTLVGAAPMPGGIPPVVVVQGALTSVEPPKVAVATIFGTAAGAGRAKTLLGSLGGPDIFKEANVSEATRGSESVLMGGVAEDPKSVFEVGSRSDDALLYVAGTASGPAFPAFTSGMSAALRIDRRGPALVAQAGLQRGAVPTLDFAPDYSAVTWDSPILPYPGAQDTKCIVDAANGLIETFRAVATVAADQRSTLMATGMRELADTFACEGGPPEVKARTKRLEAMMQAVANQFGKGI